MSTARRRQILAWTTTERLGLADLLAELKDYEWRTATLCDGWDVRDLAAHLTLSTRLTLRLALPAAIRARGNFDRMNDVLSRERAARYAPAELVAQLRETAASPRRAPGTSVLDPLVDMLVHGQDLARPLGRVRAMPIVPAVAALEYVLAHGAHRQVKGQRLVATDLDWAAGEGPTVTRAPLADLLLLATGRPVDVADQP
ncbi:maleylpyruvate isomerase family mycothiol-dependent enzyme [Kribbella sancticallisti]|uniref:Maleylpyruvate isomerase family mycothiol-dependent enzyme n=1 Tax=Kribbella sancticallisti TaxID=460087 RepID=A0ABN2DPR3_9ACTN